MDQPKKYIPYIESKLRHNILEMPEAIRRASGILIYGRRIKSLVFTTDLAIIKTVTLTRFLRSTPLRLSSLSVKPSLKRPMCRCSAA